MKLLSETGLKFQQIRAQHIFHHNYILILCLWQALSFQLSANKQDWSIY